jgi:formylglycine-generating enzyme required for sulfatase activity
MSVDVAGRLRSLAQDYHDGRLDLAAYRSLRAPLLDSLAIGGAAPAPVEITQPRGAVAQREAITRPGRPRQVPSTQDATPAPPQVPVPDSPPPRPPTSRPLVLIGVAVVIAIGIAIALWASRDHGAAGQGAAAASGPGQAGGAGHSEPERVHVTVDQFVGRADWGDASLTTLNAALVELGSERIALMARETWFQRFTDEVRRRLKEQQALAQQTLTVDNSPLAALAVTVGLDLNSPDAAIHIAAAPPPPPQSAPPPTRAPPSGTRPNASAAPPVSAPSGQQTTAVAHAAPVALHSDPSLHGAPSATSAQVATAPSTGTPPVTAPAASASTAASQDACRVELLHTRHPICHDALLMGAEGPLMAVIPAGAFDMGSTASSEEQPVHHVTIAQAFAVSVYEVSQGEFKQFCESTHRTCAPQPWAGDDYPVVNVSWDDARAYTEWLSSVTHHRYTLPTEAQWEYAARAGVTGLFPSGTELSPTDANYSMLSKQTVAARRSQKYNANAFRLMHTVGNVREWVEDAWVKNFAGAPADGSAVKSTQGPMRVARGGSYADGSARLRISLREGLEPSTKDVTTGFRIARELP